MPTILELLFLHQHCCQNDIIVHTSLCIHVCQSDIHFMDQFPCHIFEVRRLSQQQKSKIDVGNKNESDSTPWVDFVISSAQTTLIITCYNLQFKTVLSNYSNSITLKLDKEKCTLW